jgi:hypothetical protein
LLASGTFIAALTAWSTVVIVASGGTCAMPETWEASLRTVISDQLAGVSFKYFDTGSSRRICPCATWSASNIEVNSFVAEAIWKRESVLTGAPVSRLPTP